MRYRILLFTLLLLGLSACRDFKGVFGDKKPAVFTPNSSIELTTTNGGTQTATVIDINGDGIADGLDLDGDGIAEILFLVIVKDQQAGIDLNGDGIADFYLVALPDGTIKLQATISGGNDVTLTTDAGGNPIGFDANNDNVADSQILQEIQQDTTPPTSSLNSVGGTFTSAQTVTITCNDNTACNSIAYTINGTEPSFSGGSSTVLIGGQDQITISQTATLKWVVRDANGNVETPVQSLGFTIEQPTVTSNCTYGSSQYGQCTFAP